MRKIRVDRDGSFWKRITDGQNFLSVDFDKDGRITSFTRNAGNDARDILTEIAETCDVEIVSEHEPKFWGFETQEEWDASWEALADQQQQELCEQIIRFVRGKPNDIRPGTIAMSMAESAKHLAAKLPRIFWLSKSGRS